MKFLIVHSDRFTQRAIEIALRDLHHETALAQEGLDAIDQALDHPPDAVLIATELPGLSGLDVARALRALTPTQHIPILLLTAGAEGSAGVEAAGLTNIDILEPPLDLTRVRDRLLRLAAQARAALPENEQGAPELTEITDPLTGLYARRYMLHRLSYEGARARRYGQNLAAILLATDSPDEIGRTYGASAADRARTLIGSILRRGLRIVDLVGRISSDEFLIIAPHTDSAGAMTIARRLKNNIENAPFEVNGKSHPLRVCIGIAHSPGNNLADNLALFARAEAALARARQNRAEPIVSE